MTTRSLRLRRRVSMAFAAFVVAAAATPAFAVQGGVTYYPQGRNAWYVSADGSTVVGVEDSADGFPTTFVLRGGAKTTVLLPGGVASIPSGVSADGTTVVGSAEDENGAIHAFVWTVGDSFATRVLPDGFASNATAVSADGTTVIGEEFFESGSAGFVARADGMTSLSLGGMSASPLSVSTNGGTVVGFAFLPDGEFAEAFVWNAGDAAPTLIPFSVDSPSAATKVSADGSTVIGMKAVGANTRGFLWRVGDAEASTVDLGGGESMAYAVSADGSAVVGDGLTETGATRAFALRNGVVEILAPPVDRQHSSAFVVTPDGTRVAGNVWNDLPAEQTLDFDSRDAFVWDDAGPSFVKDLAGGVAAGSPRLRTVLGMTDDGGAFLGESFLRSQGSDGSFIDLFGTYLAIESDDVVGPAELIEALIAKVQGLNINQSLKTTLLNRLNVALAATERDRPFLAALALADFAFHVKLNCGRKIPLAVARDLIEDAVEIIRLLVE
jgi:probable HAF family extracellular repeat protein